MCAAVPVLLAEYVNTEPTDCTTTRRCSVSLMSTLPVCFVCLCWCCVAGVYMPLLPVHLSEFLSAPVPFIAGIPPLLRPPLDRSLTDSLTHLLTRVVRGTSFAGINTSYLQGHGGSMELPEGVVIVNLDSNSVTLNGSASFEAVVPPFPSKPVKKLLAGLKECAAVHDPTHPMLQACDLAYPNGEDKLPITNFSSLSGIRMKYVAALFALHLPNTDRTAFRSL